MTDAATQAQNAAAHPKTSTWLTANAGSGKTRVLTNRVARLLLNGVDPQNILCLTYTKAAASEMQNRLFKTLGAWAMLDESELREALSGLGEIPPNDLSRARTLFASAIETPGGLKIQTIHSFCSKILRQFPLEAGVSPEFQEMDEPMQRDVITQVISKVALANPGILQRVRRVYSGESLTDLAKDVAKNAEVFAIRRDPDEVFATFDVPAEENLESIVNNCVSADDIAFLKSFVPILREQGSTNDQKLADALESLEKAPSPRVLEVLEDKLLTKRGTTPPFTFKMNIPTKSVRSGADFSPLVPRFTEIGARVEAARKARINLSAAMDAIALQEFAQALLPEYTKAKADGGLLDFDDLIRRTKALLSTRSLAWVLYRLDGRIDHVLVDEAQDTSPMQWDVIEALTAEMMDGESDRSRTLFVVGDKKQSIYSFQGADAEGFDRRAGEFRARLASRDGIVQHELYHSFRSSPAILQTVDTLFSQQSGAGEATDHKAFHQSMPGRVDLWPLIPKSTAADELPWYDTSPRTIESDATFLLASKVASEISELLKTGTIQGEKGKWRRIQSGDIMILVQRRSALFDQIISACKDLELGIAGADRLKVGSELAVRDILALLSFLALPEDDLSLAAALRSPLLGWSEQQLFDLAARRDDGAYLWQAMRDRSLDYAETVELLTELRRMVDFLRPYELIELVLSRYEGRKRFLERLGHEAEDGLDELLNQALSYERSNVPSLTGFLAHAKASEIEIRRESETTGNLIRVMTVHGAKGLESPIVILPDTTFTRARSRQDILSGPNGIPFLPRNEAQSPAALSEAKTAKKQAEEAERDRLLYVAMTRAEKWLIVCGVEPSNAGNDALNWHARIKSALEAQDAAGLSTPTGEGLRHSSGQWQNMPDSPVSETHFTDIRAVMPEFGTPAPTAGVEVLSPSKLGGEKVLPGEPESGSGGARRGRQLHALLEAFSNNADLAGLAHGVLSTGPDAATDDELTEIVAQAGQIIDLYPELFGENTLAEVDIVADIPALGGRISGAIDRLVITPDRILAVDFKTNAHAPATPETTPPGLLRQMAAYLAGLEKIYPDRSVDVAILWTATANLMRLPHGIVRETLERPTTS